EDRCATRRASAMWSGCGRRPAGCPRGRWRTWPTPSPSTDRWRARSPMPRSCWPSCPGRTRASRSRLTCRRQCWPSLPEWRRGLRVAWSADLGLPVEAAVQDVLAPARQVLVDLGCEVVDAAPDLSGADEVFRAWRAFRFAAFFGPLLDEHRARLGPNVTWNTEQGLALTTDELLRATALRATLTQRVAEFFTTVEVLACPVSQVVPFDVTLEWVHEIDGVPHPTYLAGMASPSLIPPAALPASSVPAGFPPDGLPVGLQLPRRWRADWPLLGVAHAFEAATGYAKVAPVLP